jgi:transposase-like protein
MTFAAVGRKYGVSDNAVRKWLRWYERDREATQERKAA